MRKLCAIYTRKSTEERLDMEFNSLDAQREACEAYITSQRSEGWQASAEAYDDGGFSGGTMDRPALNRLLDDVKAGKIQIIVVYKIDRLTRSLMDFSKLVEIFDAHGVTFVSVTQSFNTTTSMGRLTLNVLLSFAQFEREVTGERIRDKVAASKQKGMWMGGVPPAGYKIENRRLAINPDEVEIPKLIYQRYLELGSVGALKRDLDRMDVRSPVRTSRKGNTYGNVHFSLGALYLILKNPAYAGKIKHKEKTYKGDHEAIIPEETWERVQHHMNNKTATRRKIMAGRHVLQGLLFDRDGVIYSPTHTQRTHKHYRYYISQNLLKYKDQPHGVVGRVCAYEIERAVEQAVRDQIPSLCREQEEGIRDHILKNQHMIVPYDLIRNCVARIVMDVDILTLTLKPAAFHTLVEQQLRIALTKPEDKPLVVTVPYKIKGIMRGRSYLETGETTDGQSLFDQPPETLKKLVQGVIWRNAHFDGMTLKDIARQEGCSEGHVGKVIFESLTLLQTAA